MRSRLALGVLACLAIIGAAFWVAERRGGAALDVYGRLSAFPGKAFRDCPAQTTRTVVLLALGQSNIANHAQQRARTAFPDRVVNYYAGRCAVAASPLLGSTGEGGEWLTLLGDELIRSGRYDAVVIVPAAVAGRTVGAFADGELSAMVDETLAAASPRYSVTHVLWHQGEADFHAGTTTAAYKAAFRRLLARLRNATAAPIFVSVATYCPPIKPGWHRDNPVALAQRELAGEVQGVRPGVDTDSFDPTTSRYDRCHFSAEGQSLAARSTAERILEE